MARIDLEGFDGLNDLLQKMTLTEEDKKRAMRAALVPVKDEVQKNTPVDTGKLQKSIKTQVGKKSGETIGKVIMGEYYGKFQEYGTSHQRKNVGFFARSIRASRDEAMKILKAEIFHRLK